MSTSNVLTLEEYRGRRTQRLRLAESLYRASKPRASLLTHVAEAASITGADRAAIVWVDEYGPGLVHPHVVIDLLADRPRRSFSPEPLRRAWELGVPAALDEPALAPGNGQSTLAVALGSDGTRAWFLVTESVALRPTLARSVRERIMFLAGECSAIVLHRDLDQLLSSDGPGSEKPRFAGWPVLQDMEGREADEAESSRISRRFVVARLARMLVDDDLTLPLERISEQAKRARVEIGASDGDIDTESRLWLGVLDAFESMQMDDLATTLIHLGEQAEAEGHHNGALELYRCAYEIAAAVGFPTAAADAARLCGRVTRRRADWATARDWYATARAISEDAFLDERRARSMAGLATIDRDRGNLPGARTMLLDALPYAARSGDGDTLGSIYHELLTVEAAGENLSAALEYGWLAVTTYVGGEAKVRGLSALAGALQEAKEYTAAEDAWALVAHGAREKYYKVYAWDALAYLAALRGDGEAFDRRAARCDALGWDKGQASARSEILYFRGLACRALGRMDDAEKWLHEAMSFAEKNGFGRIVFKAEEALRALHDEPAPVEEAATVVDTPAEVRVGLREMRVELVGPGV